MQRPVGASDPSQLCQGEQISQTDVGRQSPAKPSPLRGEALASLTSLLYPEAIHLSRWPNFSEASIADSRWLGVWAG